MEAFLCLVTFWVDGFGLGQAPSPLFLSHRLEMVNSRLHGQLLDYTHNHGADNRIWSAALQQKRDVYVYLPPNFDPNKKYPLTIFLHGAGQDERFFLQTQVEGFDKAIADGVLPPFILVAPDGSMHGRATLIHPATFWANTKAGCFEDYVMQDVWNFAMTTFPICPDRGSHALVGASMGGTGTFALAIKHRDRIKIAIGFMPLVNLRYVDCRDRYRTNFDPSCAGLRSEFRGYEALGRRKLFVLRFNDLYGPLFGKGPDAIAGLSDINPYELMDRTNLQDGELDMYIAYGGKDEFNVTAQVDSFLYHARERGICITVDFDPNGRHDLATGKRQMPAALKWAGERVPKMP